MLTVLIRTLLHTESIRLDVKYRYTRLMIIIGIYIPLHDSSALLSFGSLSCLHINTESPCCIGCLRSQALLLCDAVCADSEQSTLGFWQYGCSNGASMC
jgi:hypothetical protein